MSLTNPGEASYSINVSNGLLLYYHYYSFYSQKVVMALHEKKLPFEAHLIDITKGVQYEPWFLQINPRGEVPVLQDIGKVIPDSSRIIDYLEDNFSNGDTPRLIPMDQGAEVRQRITHFRSLIDQIPSGVITMGSFVHTDLVKSPKAPFYAPVRKLLKRAEDNSSTVLRAHAEKNPNCQQVLLQKAELQDIKHQTVIDRNEYLKVLGKVDDLLGTIEQELSNHTKDKENWWLCSDRFTVADIGLTILLERLNQLGFEFRFWSDGKRPLLEKYYERVRQRESYKKTIPSTFLHIKTLLTSQKPIYIGIGMVAAVAIIVSGVLLVKKFLS